jgi:hypothetical protein
MDDASVFLSIHDDEFYPLLLNLFEMWCFILLQTLTKNVLSKYLPEEKLVSTLGGI